jgi:hypothetical protein
MLSIDAWSLTGSVFQIFAIAYVGSLGAIMIQGQIPQHLRQKHPLLYNNLPAFKLSPKSPVSMILYFGGFCVIVTEFTALATTMFPGFTTNGFVCDLASRIQAIMVLSDYFSLMALMFLRSRASRPPEGTIPKFEIFIFSFLLIFAPIALGVSVYFARGQIVTTIYEGGQSRSMCILIFTNIPYLVAFTLADIFISVSLLVIFYNRIQALDLEILNQSQRDEFTSVAKQNLRCSCIILFCTICITQIIISLDLLFQRYGQLVFIFNIPLSVLFCIVVTTVVAIFERQYVWHTKGIGNSDESIAMLP